MTPRTQRNGTRRAAHKLAALGYHLVPCEPGGKRPLIPWKQSESGHASIETWFDRFGTEINLAIQTRKSRVVVLDADSAEAESWITQHCPRTPMLVRTPRGGSHHYFCAEDTPPLPAQNLFDISLDVRAGDSVVIVPLSWSSEHKRHWVWLSDPLSPTRLPTIPSSLVEKQRPILLTALAPPTDSIQVRAITRWIMAVESIQGNYGSNQCFKVACRLVDAGLPWHEAWRWMCQWNASGKAIPPWSEAELRHKLEDAFARFTRRGAS